MVAGEYFVAVKGGGNVRYTALHHTVLPHDLMTMSSRV
jgi:hypothetical protein